MRDVLQLMSSRVGWYLAAACTLVLAAHFALYVHVTPSTQMRELTIPALPSFNISASVAPAELKAQWQLPLSEQAQAGQQQTKDGAATNAADSKRLADTEVQLLSIIIGAKRLATLRVRAADGSEQIVTIQPEQSVADARLTKLELLRACFDYDSGAFCLQLFPATKHQLSDNPAKDTP